MKIEWALTLQYDWFDGECHRIKVTTRHLEKEYRRTKRADSRDRWRSQFYLQRRAFQEAQKWYYSSLIKESSDSKALWRNLQSMLKPDGACACPHTAASFADFFDGKIETIRAGTEHCAPPDISTRCVPSFQYFSPCSAKEVSDFIGRAPHKQCSLDPVPAWIVKECSELLSPVLATMINILFSEGIFPSKLGSAIISPILKKPNLDPFELKSWHSISNLSFVSKLFERIAVSRLGTRISSNQLLPVCQSATQLKQQSRLWWTISERWTEASFAHLSCSTWVQLSIRSTSAFYSKSSKKDSEWAMTPWNGWCHISRGGPKRFELATRILIPVHWGSKFLNDQLLNLKLSSVIRRTYRKWWRPSRSNTTCMQMIASFSTRQPSRTWMPVASGSRAVSNQFVNGAQATNFNWILIRQNWFGSARARCSRNSRALRRVSVSVAWRSNQSNQCETLVSRWIASLICGLISARLYQHATIISAGFDNFDIA